MHRIAAIVRTNGVEGLARMAAQRLLRLRASSYRSCARAVRGRRGIEIGGPSSMFRRGRILPLYPLLAGLDNCTFSRRTIWEGEVREGPHFAFDSARPPGFQYVRDATDLHGIRSASYDVVLSSNVLEHVANPHRAMNEWIRVLKPAGVLVLALPHRDGTFDHRRPVTPRDHLRDDFRRGVGEDDLTHLAEILELHDLSRDPGAGTRTAFEARGRDNLTHRALHHHVFDTRSAAEFVRDCGLRLVAIEAVRPSDILMLATTNAPTREADLAEALSRSPFPSDRV